MNMKTKIFFAAILFLAAACNNNENKEEPADSSATNIPAVQAPQKICFLGVIGKDSIKLSLQLDGTNVSGNLNYLMAEKDSNTGRISGNMQGDTLFADYNFASEGQQSMRQVAFLLQDSVAVPGYGDMIDNNGKMDFKDHSKISFDKKSAMKAVNCLP